MKRAYYDLMEQISVPSGLNDRVLQTIRQEAAGVGTRWKRTALRAAVCAACALALVLGTVRLAPRSAEEPGLTMVSPMPTAGWRCAAAPGSGTRCRGILPAACFR